MVAMCHPCHDHLLRALQITQVLTVAQRDLFLIGVWGPCRILENWNMSWAIPEHTVKHSFQHIPAILSFLRNGLQCFLRCHYFNTKVLGTDSFSRFLQIENGLKPARKHRKGIQDIFKLTLVQDAKACCLIPGRVFPAILRQGAVCFKLASCQATGYISFGGAINSWGYHMNK